MYLLHGKADETNEKAREPEELIGIAKGWKWTGRGGYIASLVVPVLVVPVINEAIAARLVCETSEKKGEKQSEREERERPLNK